MVKTLEFFLIPILDKMPLYCSLPFHKCIGHILLCRLGKKIQEKKNRKVDKNEKQPFCPNSAVTGEVGNGLTRRYAGGFSFPNFNILMCLVKSADSLLLFRRHFTSIFNLNLNLNSSIYTICV